MGDQKQVLTHVTGGVNALPGRCDAFPTGHEYDLNRLNTLSTRENLRSRSELIGCASTDAPRAALQTPNPSTLTLTEGLSQEMRRKYEVEIHGLTSTLNQKLALIEKLADDLDNKEYELEIEAESRKWDMTCMNGELARAE